MFRFVSFFLIICITCSVSLSDTRAQLPKQQLANDLYVSFEGRRKLLLGDNPQYAVPEFDDSDWPVHSIPGSWRTQGVPVWQYTGWHRIWFDVPHSLPEQKLAGGSTVESLEHRLSEDCKPPQ